MILFTLYSCKQDQTVVKLLSQKNISDTLYIYKTISVDNKIYMIETYLKLDSLDQIEHIGQFSKISVRIVKTESFTVKSYKLYTYKTITKSGLSRTHSTKLVLDSGDVVEDY